MCTEASVRLLVEDFLGAYNAGESNLTDRFFSLSFEWYSDSPGRNDMGGMRSTLDAYFTARQAQGDHLGFQKMTYFAYEYRDGTGGFGADVNRTDDKSPQQTVLSVKGVVDCPSERIRRWSMGEVKRL